MVNQRKHTMHNFLSEVFHTIKIQNFDHQSRSDFFLCKKLFFFAGWTGSYIFGVFKCQISACRFLNPQVLMCGFLLLQKLRYDHILSTLELLGQLLTWNIFAIIKLIDSTDLVTNIMDICTSE